MRQDPAIRQISRELTTVPLRPVLFGVLAIVAFDLVASLASRSLGFRYSYATVGSWIIHVAVGFAIGRQSTVGAASIGVAIVAFTEATIGWTVPWAVGPGRPAGGRPGGIGICRIGRRSRRLERCGRTTTLVGRRRGFEISYRASSTAATGIPDTSTPTRKTSPTLVVRRKTAELSRA